MCALHLTKTKKKKQRNNIPSILKKKHTFAFLDGNIGIMHFTTGVRFQANVRNDTKPPQ